MDFVAARAGLVASLRRVIDDGHVLDAMAQVPREFFVPRDVRDFSYEDRPLSIGRGQTISQPYIVALMTHALELTGNEKVLEIGTGSGYQSAILGKLAKRVITVERVAVLAERARRILTALQYNNIEIHLAGEVMGWEQESPYDAILVTAGAPEVPASLLAQLKMGGRLVVPVGTQYSQELLKITRRAARDEVESLGGCQFVPLIGEEGWEAAGKG
ncbi:MAG: protein-L-isoaspartate(D-aspartate) O-methyltransferase [Dehalococcoidales bacterium]|nr:protein-L-isoaspartate(D-aspartate) O-methyltransferase [Dehalococcoidales bacterium]